ncbi:hypothetical protein BDD21_3845 [Thiocapsa rosea]|uniref:Uncharacterized protein n=1 Tax=Thiocapsa rosea TaxID=69360 RepID=A0A495VD80_9GAMM|nr:hypothetical protein BDD21_3845 [Thiocapsa rosea]
MTYTYQMFGAMTGWSFLYGCMLGIASPANYLPRQARMYPVGSDDALAIRDESRAPGLSQKEQV